MVFVKGVGNVEFFDSLDGELAVDDEGKFYTKFPDYASTMPPAVTPYSEEDAEEAHGELLGGVESHRYDRFLGRREPGSASYAETSEAGDRGFGDDRVEHLKPTDRTLERIESGELDETVALRSTPGLGSMWGFNRETAYRPESVKTSEFSEGRFAGSGGLTDEELRAMSVTRSREIAMNSGAAPKEGDEGYDIWMEEYERDKEIAEKSYQKAGGDAEDAAKAGMHLADFREDQRLQREAEGRSEGMGWVAPVYYGFEDLTNTLLQDGYRFASTVEWIGGDAGLDEHANELQRMRNLEERVRGKGREGKGETYAERTYRQAGTELVKYVAVGLTAGAVTRNAKAAEGAVMAFAASESFNQQYVESIDQGHGRAEATMHGGVKAGITAAAMYYGNRIGRKLGMGPMDFAGVNIARRLIGKEAAETALDLSTKKLGQSMVDFAFSVTKGGAGEVAEETADMLMGMFYDRMAYNLAGRELGAGAEGGFYDQLGIAGHNFIQLLGPSLAGGGAGKLMPGGEAYDNAVSGVRVVLESIDENYRNMENEMVGRRQANRDIAKRLGIISKDERGVGYDELHRTILSNLKSTKQDVREGTIQALKDLEDMRLPKKPSRKDFTDKTGRKESSRSQREGYDQEVATVLRHGEAFEHIFEERSYEEVMEDIFATHPDLVEEYAERKAAIKESEDAVERREQLLEELEVMQVEDPDLADSLRESALAHVKETAPKGEAPKEGPLYASAKKSLDEGEVSSAFGNAVDPMRAWDDETHGPVTDAFGESLNPGDVIEDAHGGRYVVTKSGLLAQVDDAGNQTGAFMRLRTRKSRDTAAEYEASTDARVLLATSRLVKKAEGAVWPAKMKPKGDPKTKKASAGVDLTVQEQIKQQARPVTKATEHRDDILAIQKAIPGAQIEQVAIPGEGTPSGGFRAYRWRLMPGRKKKGEKLKENTGIVMWVDEETLAYRGESRALREEAGLPTQRLADFKLNTGRITLDGLGVVRLSAALEGEGKQIVVDGRVVPMGIDKALRHELVHLARAAGLFTDKEWSGFVKKYSDPSKSELDQEEDIALASALWEQDSGFRNGLKQFLRKIIEAIRGLGGRESSQAIKDEVAATEQAFLAGEVLKRNRIAEDSELIALWREKLGQAREEGKRIVEEMPEGTPASDIPTEVIVDAAADVVAGRDLHPKVQKKMFEEPEVMEARIENAAKEMSDPSPEPEGMSEEERAAAMQWYEKVNPSPEPGATAPRRVAATSLPKGLSSARPRYNMGSKSYQPKFASDVDLALYIVARTGSKRDADYMKWLKEVFPGRGATEIREMGAEVRRHLRGVVQESEPGAIDIPESRISMDTHSDLDDSVGMAEYVEDMTGISRTRAKEANRRATFNTETRRWSDGGFMPIGNIPNSRHISDSSDQVPTPKELRDGLKKNQRSAVAANRELLPEDGRLLPGGVAKLRIDIPFFNRTGQYAVTVHGRGKGVGKVLGYDSTAQLSGEVAFFSNEGIAEKILHEGKSKTPIATVQGRLIQDRSIPGDIDSWVPVGYNPHKAVYFYDKTTGREVVAGVDAISIGNTVYTRSPEYGARSMVPATLDDSVGMAEYVPRRKVKGQSKSTQNKHALEPRLRVTTRHKKIGKKRFLQKTTNKNAPSMLAELSSLLDRHKTPEESEAAWNSMMVDAYGSNDIPVAPRKLISDLQSGEAARLISSLTDGQLAEANIGFKNAAEFRDAYLDGRVSVEQTGKLFLWSFLSRGVSPYTQESLFLNAWGGVDRWIKAAADGTLEARKDDYEAWAKSVAPKDMGIPGAGATHNLNAFGHAFLVKMSQDSGDGRSNLQLLHDMMSDPDSTGTEIRRVFQRIGEGVGIDNKVVSFTLLVAGYTDLMVIDRVQLRHLWNDGTFDGINLWDGDKIDKQTVTGSSLASITYGVRGLVVYEAIERAVRARVQEIYNQAGRPQDASVGRYHWESWVAASQQEASHATLHAILSDIRGEANPTSGLMAREGDYGQLSFSARYGVDDNGGYILYNPPGGDLYRFTLGDWAAFRSEIGKKGKTKVLPPGFIIGYKQIQSKRRLTEEESYLAAMPWHERPGVNKEKLKQEAMKYGTPVRETTEDVRAVDGTAVGGKAVSHRPSADQPGTPGSRQSATTRGRADLQQEDSVALMGFDSIADMLRAGVKFFSGSKPEKAAESEPARPSRTPSSPSSIPTVSEGERIVGDTHVSPGRTPETKEEIARVQRRISIPVHDTTFTEEMAAEDARIDGDYDGELAKMLAEIDTVRAEVESGFGSMTNLTDSAEKNFRFQALMEEATRRMIAAKSGDGWTDGGQAYDILERLTLAYAEGGSEQGRAFASRRAIDPSLAPATRREKELLAIVASLIKEKASKNPGKSKNATDVLNKLAKLGFDINDIAGIAADPMRSIEFLNQMRAASASWGDGLYEYWRNSLLSGVQTQAVNMAGTAGFMSYVSMFERAVAATAGTAARPFHSALGTKTGYDAATFREFGWMFHGMGDAFKNAFRNASMTWRAERSEFDTLNNQSHRVRDYYSGQKGGAIAAGSPKISGDLGKWVRLIGFRPASAVDDLLKTLAQHFETNALAARIAAVDTGQKWGSPEFLEVFNEQLLHPNSMARRLATERAMTGAFQGDEGILMRGSAGALSQKLHESSVGRWFHPFHKTPLNITDEALKRAPVLGFVVDVMDYRNRKAKREAAGKPFKGFAEDGLTDSLARQAVALTVSALLLSMNDEEDPWITGAQGGVDTKKRQLAYASGYAPMTIGVGGGYRVSYARVEPLATVLGAFVDIQSSWARGEDMGTMAVAPISSAFNQLSDKTFLRGMSDMVQLYENIGKEDGGGMNALANFGANFASTWVPNMYRQASREYGGTIDETKLWGEGSVLKTLQRAGQKAELPFVTPPRPRYDQWGRPLTRRPFGRSPITDVGYGVLRAANPARVYSMDQATKVDLALYRYNAQRPADKRIYLTTPSKSYTDFYGEKQHLNDAQWAQYQKYVGTYALKSIDGLGWIDPENPTTVQMEKLKSLYRKAAKKVKDRLIPQWMRGEDGSIPALD